MPRREIQVLFALAKSTRQIESRGFAYAVATALCRRSFFASTERGDYSKEQTP
jgi:hypothetical protein